MIDPIEIGIIAALACGPVALVGTIVNAFWSSDHIRRLQACRAKSEDVTRMWDAVDWVEGVFRFEKETGSELLTGSEDTIQRWWRSTLYTETQQAAEARLMAAIDAEPPTQLYRRQGSRFVRAGNDQSHADAGTR